MEELIKKLTSILEQLEQYHGSLITLEDQQSSAALPYAESPYYKAFCQGNSQDAQMFRYITQLYKQARDTVVELDTKQSELAVIVKAMAVGALTYNNGNDCLECHYCQYSGDRPYHDKGCPVRLAITKLEQHKTTITTK